jgi:glutathione S-transferase
MIELYEFPLSGNCHKVRLMLGLLGLNYKSVTIDAAKRAHKSPEFLAMNPLGQVPVLKDGNTVIRDSQAILIYLANQYGGEKWWPKTAEAIAQVSAWLMTAANEVTRGPNTLRLYYKFGRKLNIEDAGKVTESLLHLLENTLTEHQWLYADVLSIADVAIYPYIALAQEGQVELSGYPSVLAWMTQIQELPGYVDMPGIWHPKPPISF